MLSGGGNTPQASLTLPPATPAAAQMAKIQIAPVIGSPDNVARDLQSQLASSIGHNGVQVATAANATSEYVVRGYIVAAREKTKAKISYIWDITDQAGKRVHRITGEEVIAGAGKDPWSAVTPPVVQSIADKTSKQIASWLATSASIPVAANTKPPSAGTPPTTVASNDAGPAPSPSYPTAPNTPIAPTTGSITTSGPITAIVPMVTGAPGDGSSTLTTAIQRELTKNGLALSNVSNAQAYKVEGKVAMGQSKDGKQPIQIDWNVIDPTGKKLGTVSQKNEVPQGSLDGSWGKTADAAAAAAAQGIIKLLPAKSTD
ncbi:hypothetical protein [Hyphomicrobium facile]|nr:hypothetical protein [Hyphomicrobium facile]